MPILNWIGKEKIVNHDKEVPFRLLKKNKKYSLGESENLIVEGDNLEALKALMPFYHGQVKCIYIDPPYNTGNERWVYNDRVNSPKIKEWLGKVVGPEGEDLTRHDKWLCMMYPRLKLLQDLLSNDGVICVSIDDIELARLITIMDEIFGAENKEEIICWRRRHNQPNDKSKAISKVAEFIVIYAKNLVYLKKKKTFYGLPLTGDFSNPDNDPKGDWASKPWKAGSNQTGCKYKIITPTGKVLQEEWLGDKETYKKYLAEKRIFFPRKGDGFPRKKYYKFEREEEGQCAHNFWGHETFGSNQEATEELKSLNLPEFDNPKPVRLIQALLSIFTYKNSLILDSFAGSGTTAQAVVTLNAKDNNGRKYILVELEKDICRNITAKRARKVAKGYSYKKNGGEIVKVKGLGGGFEYVELGDALFNSNGMINESVSFIDMASYVFFTETHTNLDKNKIKENYIGEYAETHYFLLFDGIGKNILNRSFLKELKAKEGRKIVYADKCLLDEEMLEKYQIIFKQIPYQVKIY